MTFERIAPEQFDTIPQVPEPAEHPSLFSHEQALADLADAYRQARLHHALLVTGPSGIGKATLAFRLAYHLLANPMPAQAPARPSAPEPGTQLFRLIAQHAHPSLLHLTRPPADRGTGFKTRITVEEVRRVGRFLAMTSHDGGYRIVIVDAADDMNRSAANALLKSLEEPPPRTLFVLVAHSPGALLPTIRSRCQVVKLKPLDDARLQETLAAVAPDQLPQAAAMPALLARARGSVRDALLMMAYGGLDITHAADELMAGSFDVERAYRIAEAVAGRDSTVQLKILNDHLLARIAGAARGHAEAGEAGRADRLARFWSETAAAIAEAETYNLDRKQHVVTVLRNMAEAGV